MSKQRTIERKGWQWAAVPAGVITSKRLSAEAVRVYACLLWRAGQADKSWPSVAGLAEDTHISERLVMRALKELIADHWIYRQRRMAGTSITYVFEQQAECREYAKQTQAFLPKSTGQSCQNRQVSPVENRHENQIHLTRYTEPTTTTAAAAPPPAVTHGDYALAATAYQDNIGSLTGFMAEELRDAVTEYTAAWIVEAIREACKANARKWSYVSAILARWKRDGYKAERPKPAARPTGPRARAEKPGYAGKGEQWTPEELARARAEWDAQNGN